MAQRAGGLAEAPDTLTKLSNWFSIPLSKSAKKGHDVICITKAKHGPTLEMSAEIGTLNLHTSAVIPLVSLLWG